MNKRRLAGLVIGAFVLLAISGASQVQSAGGPRGFKNGNMLLTTCQDDDPSYSAGACLGYVQGVSDAMDVIRYYYDLAQCPKNTTGINAKQVKDIVVKYLVAHPEKRHFTAAGLVFNGLKEAWNCDGLPDEASRRLDLH